MKKSAAVAMAARPVLPPSATPAEDSTNVVTVEVPQIAPVVVAMASGQHGLVHVGDLAVRQQHVAAGAGAVQRAEGIEHIDHAEGQGRRDEDDDQVCRAMGADIGAEVEAFREDLAEGHLAEIAERADEVDLQRGAEVAIEAGNGQAEHIIQGCAAEDAPQDSAAHALLGQDGDEHEGQNGDDHGHDGRPADIGIVEQVEGAEGNAGAGILRDEADILQAEERDEQANACGDGLADGVGDGGEDLLAQAGDGQQDEDEAVNENEHKGVGVGEAEADADGINEEGVQAHAGGLCERQIRQQSDEDGADDCRDRGGNVDGAVADAEDVRSVAERIGEHVGVDHEDVSHGHERGQTCQDLSSDGGAVFFQSKKLFHKYLPFVFAGSAGAGGSVRDLRGAASPAGSHCCYHIRFFAEVQRIFHNLV